METRNVIMLLSAMLCAAEACAQEDAANTARKLRHHTVFVESTQYGNGWGFIIGRKENTLYIVTANHVVRGVDDGDPGDRPTLKVRFFTDQGAPYDAVLQDHWISSRQQDLAVISVSEPPRYKYRRAKFGCVKHDQRNASVCYIGKDAEWHIPGHAGWIDSVQAGMLGIRNFDDAVSGTSGAPIVSAKGFEGLLLGPSRHGTSIDALSLKFIKHKLAEWKYPYAGNTLKRTTYLLAGLSAASVAGAILCGQKKNEEYDIYRQNRDETAPVYQQRSRDEVFDNAKRFQTYERLSYTVAGVAALMAYLTAKECLFHRYRHHGNPEGLSLIHRVGFRYDVLHRNTCIDIKWRF